MTRRKFIPRPYQPAAIDLLLEHPRSNLWAGMGLGKSAVVLTALDALHLSGHETRPALILGPLRVAEDVWPGEVKKWEHLAGMEVQPILGDAQERKAALRNRNASAFSINYENIPWLVETLGEQWPFGMVVADESTRLKGFRLRQGTMRARMLAKVAHAKCTRWVNLTGTPQPNGINDLWGQAWFLDAGARLGRTYDSFRQRWFQKSFDGYGMEPLPFAFEQITDKLRDISLSIRAEDHFDLKEPIVNKLYVELPGKARQLYRDMEREMFAEIEGHGIEAFNAASRTMKCLQLANGAAYIDDEGNWKEVHNAKIEALESIIEEASGAPVLVGYHFKSDLARLLKAFPGAINVGTSEGLKRAKRGEGTVWLGHPASMGHGVDGLQEHCNIIAFFGLTWNLEHVQQIIERVGPTRQLQAGKDRPVFIHYILARHTVDDMVFARIESKRGVQELLLEAMRGIRE